MGVSAPGKSMQDLVLAIAHHVLVFALFGVIFGEMVALSGVMNSTTVARLARLDLWYGILAGVIVAVGLLRAIFAAKGWAYYSHNAFFWIKLATFAAVGLLSIKPTLTFIRWRREGSIPDAASVRPMRLILHIELSLMVLIPVFAAAMARGYGEF
jgi:putative membrane protein